MSFRKCVIAVTLLLSAACGSSSSSSSPSSPSTSTTPTPTPTGPSVTAGIPSGAAGLTTTAFGANPLTVAVGTTVAWTNNDSIAHNSVANGNQWNSGTIGPGQTFRFTFTTAGSFPYRCTIHPNMVGTVTVQ